VDVEEEGKREAEEDRGVVDEVGKGVVRDEGGRLGSRGSTATAGTTLNTTLLDPGRSSNSWKT
jgi:hypothetical protein